MFTTIVILGLVLIVSLWGLSYWCVYRAGAENEYERGLADGRQELADDHAAEREAERAKVGRHARTQPRTALVTPRPPNGWHLPIPGPPRPQAGRDSGDGTLTFTKIELPATTGEMAAVTDQYLADMAVNEEQFRLGLAT